MIVLVFEKREAGVNPIDGAGVCLAGGETASPPRARSPPSDSGDFVSFLPNRLKILSAKSSKMPSSSVFCFAWQLDPSLEAKVNAQKQSVMLEEEYEVSTGRICYFSKTRPSKKKKTTLIYKIDLIGRQKELYLCAVKPQHGQNCAVW